MTSPGAVLVMMHGLTGSADLMRPLADLLQPKGWGLLIPEGPVSHPKRGLALWLRDAEPSDPIDVPIMEGIRSTAEDLATSITSSSPANAPLVVGGFSQGAAMALELLHTDIEPRIRAVLVLGGKSADPDRLANRLATIEPRRALWMHGERDLIVPISQAEEMYYLLINAGWEVEQMVHHKGHMVDPSRVDEIRRWISDVI